MKKLVKLLVIALLVSSSFSVNAQYAEDVFESYWSGMSQSRSDLTDSGYFLCSQLMYSVTYDDSDDTFTAIMKTVFSVEGTDYEHRISVLGSYKPSSNTVYITTSYVIYSETLPYEMYWIDNDVSLTVYEDAEHPGYYILHGQSEDQYYDDEFLELGNY